MSLVIWDSDPTNTDSLRLSPCRTGISRISYYSINIWMNFIRKWRNGGRPSIFQLCTGIENTKNELLNLRMGIEYWKVSNESWLTSFWLEYQFLLVQGFKIFDGCEWPGTVLSQSHSVIIHLKPEKTCHFLSLHILTLSWIVRMPYLFHCSIQYKLLFSPDFRVHDDKNLPSSAYWKFRFGYK